MTDNAQNMVAAIGRTAHSHLPCVAYCIQQSILEGLKAADASSLLAKCRHIVDDPGYIATLKAAILNDLSTGIEGMDALPVLKTSVALDLRYKKLKCLPSEQRDAVWEIVSTALENFCSRDQQVHLRFAVFMVFCINYKIEKLFEINRLIVINFW